MATLEELLDIEGVVAAGDFNRDGSLAPPHPLSTCHGTTSGTLYERPKKRHGTLQSVSVSPAARDWCPADALGERPLRGRTARIAPAESCVPAHLLRCAPARGGPRCPTGPRARCSPSSRKRSFRRRPK